jgi:putative hydrolase of the HAD superfamily
VPAAVVQQIIELGKAMIAAPTELLEHVADVIPLLARDYPLLLVTKGDLFDQEAKLARSGLAEHFQHVEIVSDKTPQVYQRLLAKHDIAPARFLMVGNSLRSDIVPVLAIGAHAVYIPYHLTWAYEQVAADALPPGIVELAHIGQLPGWLTSLDKVTV